MCCLLMRCGGGPEAFHFASSDLPHFVHCMQQAAVQEHMLCLADEHKPAPEHDENAL